MRKHIGGAAYISHTSLYQTVGGHLNGQLAPEVDFLIFSFGVYSSKSGVSNLNDWSSPSGQTRGSTSALIVFVCNKIKCTH